jgi:acetyl esterase/lipase
MSREQHDFILQLAEKAPPPERPAPADLRGWFEAINAQTPVAEGLEISSIDMTPWTGDWLRPCASDGKRLIIYYHGGGFLFGSPRSHRAVTTQLAQMTAEPVLSIDYRLAPEHTAPTAHDDCFAASTSLMQGGRICVLAW